MKRIDAPAKQAKPFGINGQREPLLPTTPAGDNTASYDLGFPPITMILKSAGGLPPKGQDINQILFELSSLARWSSAGALNNFDSTFSAAIGGYPKGAVLLSDAGTNLYISTVDGNTNNPNSGSSGWVSMLSFIGAAPISSPIFTGEPKAPTPALDKNDTSIATTAFVQAIAATMLKISNNLSEIAKAGAAAQLSSRTNLGLESVIGQLANGGTFASCTSNGYYLVAITDPTGISDMPKFNGTYALGSGFLFVSKSESSICQTYITSNGGMCSRFKFGSGSFSEWDFKFSSVYKPTLDNLGLSGGSLLPVGTPVPWSLSTPPTGWLVCNGAAFSTTANPKLAIAYPSGALPDLRGEFIRGWDNARGVDSGRTLLSAQTDAIRDIVGGNIRTVISSNASTAPTGAFDAISIAGNTGSGTVSLMNIDFKASRVVPTATDNRPRNIAFNYIVKAE